MEQPLTVQTPWVQDWVEAPFTTGQAYPIWFDRVRIALKTGREGPTPPQLSTSFEVDVDWHVFCTRVNPLSHLNAVHDPETHLGVPFATWQTVAAPPLQRRVSRGRGRAGKICSPVGRIGGELRADAASRARAEGVARGAGRGALARYALRRAGVVGHISRADKVGLKSASVVELESL